MRYAAMFILLYLPLTPGCVSKSVHLDTVAQLEEARKAGLKNSDAFET
jgi:hypothetical protein